MFNICIISVLCGDLTYVILFPQLLLTLYFPPSNTYGSVLSFLTSFSLRLLVGDQYLGITRVISLGMLHTPCPTVMDPQMMCEGEMPFRTIIMLIGMVNAFLQSHEQIFDRRIYCFRFFI